MALSNVQWRKSSRSGYETNCIDVAAAIDRIFIRDSKAPTGPIISCNHAGWMTFLGAVKNGDFDLR